MGREIERKFLTDRRDWEELGEGVSCRQGYIPTVDHRTVRIRIAGNRAFLTIKGPEEAGGRLEFEYPVPTADAEEILVQLCSKPIIEKTRYRTDHKGHTLEVDVFHSDNEGLVVAEVELNHPGEAVELPPWVTEEVTGDPVYSNVNLVKNPYSAWKRNKVEGR